MPRVTADALAYYLPDKSQPDVKRYLYGYTVRLTNNSELPVTLLTRRWQLIDEVGRIQEMQGKGVMGEQPIVQPGRTYTYSSTCTLATPTGQLAGGFELSDGLETFEVEVEPLALTQPDRLLN